MTALKTLSSPSLLRYCTIVISALRDHQHRKTHLRTFLDSYRQTFSYGLPENYEMPGDPILAHLVTWWEKRWRWLGKTNSSRRERNNELIRGEYTFHYFIQHCCQNMSISVVCIYADSQQDLPWPCSSFLPSDGEGGTAHSLFVQLAGSSTMGHSLNS